MEVAELAMDLLVSITQVGEHSHYTPDLKPQESSYFDEDISNTTIQPNQFSNLTVEHILSLKNVPMGFDLGNSRIVRHHSTN